MLVMIVIFTNWNGSYNSIVRTKIYTYGTKTFDTRSIIAHRKKKKEGNISLNDVLNKYGRGPLSERENPLPPQLGLLFPISSKGSFICTIPQTGQHIPHPLLYQLWSTS